MKTLSALFLLIVLSMSSVSAQTIDIGSIVVEASRNVKDVSNKPEMTWGDTSRVEIKFEKLEGRIHLNGSVTAVFDPKSFAYYFNATGKAVHPHTVNTTLQGELESGKKWETTHITTGPSVSWCPSTLETKVTSEYSVGEKQLITVVIDGKKVETAIYPVSVVSQRSSEESELIGLEIRV